MKKIFEIIKIDITNISKNYAAVIVIVALCIIPSLYAWFNIKASWDPYSQEATSGINVGVVNNDTGTILNGMNINIGDKVIEKLKDNKQLGWKFVSEDEAEDNINKGKYYATIVLPEKFSENLTSILTDNVNKAEIMYTVNEKINAIAPKLTDKGATALQEQVTKELVEIVGTAIFGVSNDLGVKIEEQIPKISSIYNSLVMIKNSFDDIKITVDNTYEGVEKLQGIITDIKGDIPKLHEVIINAQGLSGSVEEFVATSRDTVDKLAPLIKQDIKIINELSSTVAQNVEGVKDAINSGAENSPIIIENLISKVNTLKLTTNSLIKILNSLNKISPGKPLSEIINQLIDISDSMNLVINSLNDIKGKVDSGVNIDFTKIDNIISVANNISSITDGIYSSYDTIIIPQLNAIFSEVYDLAEKTIVVLKAAEEKLPRIEEILNIAFDGVSKGEKGVVYIKEKLPEAEAMINDLVDKMDSVSNEVELMEIVNLLKADVAKRSDFLANPIKVLENKLYPMGNYGSAMTPFYTVLSLWVGLLLLTSIISVEKHGEYTSSQIYVGKLLLFLGISIIQGLIVALGDLYLLKIYCKNPVLFVIGIVFTSITFTFVVYSLVSVFGNVGKVIAIVLLVLQVAGAGGTFPIQLTPRFFQILNPYLPFTYAISFAREAIGGVVYSVLQKDILVSFIYIVISIVIAIVLKKPINNLFKGFVESFKKSEIGE